MSNMKNKVLWFPFRLSEKVLLINFDEPNQINTDITLVNIYSEDIFEIIDYIKKNDFTCVIFCDINELIKSNSSLIQDVIHNISKDISLIFYIENPLGLNNLYKFENSDYRGICYHDLLKIINDLKLENYKLYYPLLDLDNINVMYSDDYLPIDGGLDKIINPSNDEYLDNISKKLLQICDVDNKLFKLATNGFVLVVNANERIKDLKFISFQNLRKHEYQMKTLIKKDYVEKQAISDVKHINQMKKILDILTTNNINILDKYYDNKIISRYVDNHSTFDIEIGTIVNLNKQKLYDLLDDFISTNFKNFITLYNDDNVFSKYEINTKNNIKKLTYLDYGIYDMIFQNCFFLGNKYYFFDQEWMEEMLPLEFILFRNYIYTENIKKILSLEEYAIHFHFEEHIDSFWELENKLQNKINDKEIYFQITNKKNIFQQNKEKSKEIMDLKKLVNNQKEILDTQKSIIDKQVEHIHYLEKIETKYNNLLKTKIKKLIKKLGGG